MESVTREPLLDSGADCRQKQDATEWLDMKSFAEEEKFRKLRTDLERKRARRSLHHAEEQKKVIGELNNLQRDRLRFEREKQLRQRNSFISFYERHNSKKSLEEVIAKLPVNEKFFGASASLAFDPTVQKNYRPHRKTSKGQIASYGSVRKFSRNSSLTEFPCTGEDDAQRFHETCKSASKRECRRWGDAWLYAKNEQDVAEDARKRWTSLLLKSEKEKMRVLSAKGVVFLNFGLDGKNCKENGDILSARSSKEKKNNYNFEGGDKPSYCFDQKKENSDSRESMELSKYEKLTFHKAFSRPLEKEKENGRAKSSEKISNNGKLTLEGTENSIDCIEILKITEDEKSAFPKAIRLPPATNAKRNGEKSQEKRASYDWSVLTSVGGRNNSALSKESAQRKMFRRSKKSRKSAEGSEDTSRNVFPCLFTIPELEAEDSSSASSSDKSRNVPKRKRTVCSLPNLANES